MSDQKELIGDYNAENVSYGIPSITELVTLIKTIKRQTEYRAYDLKKWMRQLHEQFEISE